MKQGKRTSICFISRAIVNQGLETLIKREYLYYAHFAENFDQLIFLDVSKVFTSSTLSKGHTDSAAYRLLPAKCKVVTPRNLAEFKDFLKSNDMVVISNFSDEWPDWYIHFYLRKYRIPLIYIQTMSENRSFQSKNLHELPLSKKILGIVKKFYARVEERLFCADVDTLFISSPKNADLYKKSPRFKEIVLTNSRFYDSYLSNSYPVADECIVFLDSMLPYHLDQLKFGNQGLIDRKLYFSNLNRVLDTMEQKLGRKSVVCLHPQYKEDNIKEDFGQRQTVKHRTQEFTAKAAVVLFHESSAINNAILYNKKIIQLAGSQFNDFISSNCEAMRQTVGCPMLDMYEATAGQINQALETLEINQEATEAFLSNYIKRPGQEGIPSYRLIAGHIKSKYM